MSLNLMNEGGAACRALQGSPDWATLRTVVHELARKHANSALDAPAELQASACGYARALRDVYIAFESATTGQPQQAVKKPGAKE